VTDVRTDGPVFSPTALRALRDDEPTQRELDSAYYRFAGRKRRRSPRWLAARWAMAGLALGFGVAFAAEAVVQRAQPPTPSAPSASAVAPQVPRKTATRVAAPSAVESTESSAEPSAELPPVTAEAKRARVSSSPAPNGTEPRDPESANAAAWSRAAEGLRNNDVAETKSAPSTLEHSARDSDREAARLVRAQLALHQGDSAGALAVLQDLVNNAKSPLVRSKARALINQASPSTNFPLSFGGSGT
jgi:hypothetical protein